ncbi:MAG: hypothetical protein ACTS2F_13995 [Thainema sp.]
MLCHHLRAVYVLEPWSGLPGILKQYAVSVSFSLLSKATKGWLSVFAVEDERCKSCLMQHSAGSSAALITGAAEPNIP